MGAVTTPTPDTINPSTPKKKGSTTMLPNAKAPRTSDLDLPARLSPEHRREIIEESANSPEVAAARGWWTAYSRSEVPEVFPKWQRRVGLIGPWYSPDGVTVSYQQKAKKRRTLRSGKLAPKYESPYGSTPIIDVHPFMRDAIKDVRVDLYVTEGLKTGDYLTSQGRCTVILQGVWGFAVPGTQSKVLLPCWNHVPLQGRTVYVIYDADARTNADVQEALARLVARLEERGARVLVMYPPAVNGDGKTGADDHGAAGGDLEEVEGGARPFEPVDVARERLKVDGPLRDSIGGLWVRWDTADWPGVGGDTDRAIEKALIRFAEKRGKLVKGGVRVEASHREIAEAAGVSSMAPSRSIPRLVGRERLRLDNANRQRRARGAFVLPISPEEGARYCRHNGKIEGPQRNEKEEKQGDGFDFSSLSNGQYNPRVYTSARPLEDVPEFRHPTIRFAHEQDKRGRSVKVGHYVSRPGKRRGAMVEYLARVGGSATVSELMARFASAKTRRRDFRVRQLEYLEGTRRDRGGKVHVTGPPIIWIDGDTVSLVENWREAVKTHHELTGEIDTVALDAAPKKDGEAQTVTLDGDDTRQRKKHARQREAFRRRHEHAPDPEPEMPRVDDMRDHWSTHPDGCACRACGERFDRVVGEHVEGCRCAACFSSFKETARRKYPNRRVIPLQRRDKPGGGDQVKPLPSGGDLAQVVELRTAAEASAGGVKVTPSPTPEVSEEHPLDCLCDDCDIPAPRYARPYRGSAS
jgi:hypothetical protein